MGMPISTYTVLRTLSDDNLRPDYEHQIVRNTLSHFNMFAFVIHDPTLHRELDKKLNDVFDYLDFVTGDKLLFFAMVDPPEAWLSHGRRRRYYLQLNDYAKRLFEADSSVFSEEYGTSFAMADTLKIPIDDLPCIVVTNDFRSKEVGIFRTCATHIESQLTGLGYLALRSERRPVQYNDPEFRKQIDLCDNHGTDGLLVLSNSLAKELSNFLSCIIAGSERNRRLFPVAKNEAETSIRELYAELSTWRRTRPATLPREADERLQDEEDLASICVKIVSHLVHLHARSSHQRVYVPVDSAYLEPYTDHLLQAAYKVSLLDLSDYTPEVICLAKAFEYEINLSMVHWIRQRLGIGLPEFYNRYQADTSAMFEREDFNRRYGTGRRSTQGWRPPMMGSSKRVFGRIIESIADDELPAGWDRVRTSELQRLWSDILEQRNYAAHRVPLERSALTNIKKSYHGLDKIQAFMNLYGLKKTLSGQL